MELSVGLRFCNVARCFQWLSVLRSHVAKIAINRHTLLQVILVISTVLRMSGTTYRLSIAPRNILHMRITDVPAYLPKKCYRVWKLVHEGS